MSFTRTLYVSDTHFGHANILSLCNRPFSSAGEMDNYMVRRWNEAVAPGDLVGELVVLCHYPLRSWHRSFRGSWHFYGHCHGSVPGLGRSRDVGVDVADVAFTPRTFQELTAPIRAAEQKEGA